MNRGIVAALLTVLVWSWPAIFIKLLSTDFDVVTQNFYRYLAASLFLLVYTTLFQRQSLIAAGRNIRKFILPALLVFVFQIVWVQAIYLTTPTFATLISKLDTLFVIILSAVFFASERKITRSKYFLIGFILALLGVIGVITGRGDSLDAQFDMGVALLLLRSLLWACYIVSIRNLVGKVEPLVAATMVYALASVMFVPAALIFGDLGRIAAVPFSTNVILFGSGVLCVGIGNALSYTAIKYLGSSIPSSLRLMTPLLTGVFSYMVFRETLTTVQILSGLLLIFGCWVIIRRVAIRVSSASS